MVPNMVYISYNIPKNRISIDVIDGVITGANDVIVSILTSMCSYRVEL